MSKYVPVTRAIFASCLIYPDAHGGIVEQLVPHNNKMCLSKNQPRFRDEFSRLPVYLTAIIT